MIFGAINSNNYTMKTKFNGILTLFMALLVQITFAQERTISGVVSDETGPLPGVSIIKKGTTTGVETDFNGEYAIQAKTGDVLVFSFVGSKTVEKTVASANTINVTMTSDNVLDEVVVTALGISKDKNKLGYSAQVVNSKSITESGQSSIVNALNGKVAGVNITNSGGSPGASTNIVIRGSSSILGNNQPLFVIDGIPIDNTTDSGNSSGSVSGSDFRDYGKVVSSNRASDINPDDIASMTVLKGGAATALYGSRAVNGAVIITTKKGKNQKGLSIDLSTGITIDNANKLPEFTHKYARGRNGLYSNVTHWSWGPAYASNPVFPANTITDLDGDGTTEDVSGQAIPLFRDNYKRFWQTGVRKNVNVSVSGGNEKGTFYTSIGHTNHEGIVPNDTYERTNFTLKGDYKINDRFKVGAVATYSTVGTNAFQGGDTGIGAGLTYWHHMWDINRPWKDANSERTWFSAFVPDPNWIVNEEGEKGQVNRIIGNVNLSYDITDWLKMNYRIGVDNYSDQKKLVRPISSVNTTGRLGDIYEIRINSKDITSNLNFTGAFNLNDNLKLSYLTGVDIYDKRYDRLYVEGQELLIKNFNDISNAKTVTATNSDNNKRIIGLFGEATIDYKGYLFASITGRNDWSSTLPTNNNSFFYPSISGGFIFSELMENKSILNFGKLKGSWAKLGNDAPVFSTINTYARLTPNVNAQPIFTVSTRQNNPNIKPEISTSWEVGTELQFLDNLIGLDFTYYKRTTTDQVVPVPLSATTGFTEFITNSGEVENSGIEAILTFNDILRKSEDVRWNALLNFTKNDNKVISVPDAVEEIIIGNGYWNGTKLVARPGLPYGTFIGNAYKRNAQGQLLLDDNGVPQIAQDQVLGDINPDFILNINNSVSYKNFTLSANLEFKEGGTLYNDAEVSWIYSGLSKTTENRFYSAADPNANATKVFDGVIESTGQPSTIAVPLTNTFYHQTYNNIDENFAEDASWVRLRTLSLSYNLPSKFLENTFMNSLSFTFTGRNLWLSTDYKGVDPETNGLGAGNVQGFNTITAPNTRSYGFTLRAKF